MKNYQVALLASVLNAYDRESSYHKDMKSCSDEFQSFTRKRSILDKLKKANKDFEKHNEFVDEQIKESSKKIQAIVAKIQEELNEATKDIKILADDNDKVMEEKKKANEVEVHKFQKGVNAAREENEKKLLKDMEEKGYLLKSVQLDEKDRNSLIMYVKLLNEADIVEVDLNLDKEYKQDEWLSEFIKLIVFKDNKVGDEFVAELSDLF